MSLLTAALLSLPMARGGDWPQFMGPNGDGTSTEKGFPRTWPPEGPKVLWTVRLSRGYGSAAEREGKVYLMDRQDQQKDILRCLDLATGKEDWTYSYDAPGSIDHEGSRSTPAVSDKHVFILGPFGHLHCLDLATHQVVWQKNLVDDFGLKIPNWKLSQSPLLYQDTIVVAPMTAQIGLVALEQATGKERWRSGPVGNLAYASPKLMRVASIDQIVVVSTGGAAAVAATDGKKLWSYDHPCKIPVPNVSLLPGGRVLVTGGYNAGSALIQLTYDTGNWEVKELARIDQVGGHCHPALAYKDHLYLLCNTNERNDGMVCIDGAGKIVWQTKRAPSLDKGGSVLTGDGLMYVMDGRAGELHMVEPSPDGFKSLAKAKLLEGSEIWGPLALAEGKLLIRDQSQMKCIELKPN